MRINIEDELVQNYLAESSRNLATVETDLMAIEVDGAGVDEAREDRVLRALHAVASGAGILRLPAVQALAHQAELAMLSVRLKKLEATPETVDKLLRAVDQLREWVAEPEASLEADVAATIATLGDGQTSGREKLDGGKPRSLLVEDDFASRLLLQIFLSRYGECHIAVNGVEAVAACELALQDGQNYDLICMDIMMPEMDGREAVRRIRAMEEAHGILPSDGAKIIMTTAVDDLREVIRCFWELCDGYLVKPVDLAELLSLIKSYDLVPGGNAQKV